MWAGLTAALQLAVQLLQVILPLITDIRDTIAANNKRIADAEAEAEAAKAAAVNQQSTKESTNVSAFLQITEKAWQVRYNQILTFIQNKQYNQVLVLRLKVDDPAVDVILFDETLSPEYRSMKIVKIMQSDAPAIPTK